MRIDDNFRIEVSPTERTLVEKYIQTKGKTVGKELERTYHYATVSQCLKKYLDLAIAPAENVEECINRIAEVEELIKGL